MDTINNLNPMPDQKETKSSSPTTQTNPVGENTISVPVAIVIAGALIAGAIYWSNQGKNNSVDSQLAEEKDGVVQLHQSLENITPVNAKDHILGNPDAAVTIVEYSDMECPFCKIFHNTLKQIIEEYGKSGQVAWVYRHFPLSNLHSKARTEAIAAECAAELGGNEIFWKYLNRFFELTPSNDRTNISIVLPQIARELGLNEKDWNDCLASERHNDRIQADIKNALLTGGTGTPWSIIVTKSGKKFPLSGAQPYNEVKQLIERALKEN
jgi:protein-disulfide isomerase